jgi:hypothetical protein
VASTARSSSGRPTQAEAHGASSGKSATAAKRSSSSANSKSPKRSSSPAAKSGSRSRSAASSNRSRSVRPSASRSSNGSGASGAVSAVTGSIGSAAEKASTPIIAGGAAAAGILGGIVLGKRVLGPRRTVLGIPVPRKGLSLKPVAKEVGKAGEQIGRLTDELAQARKQAKKVGDALS